MHAEATITKTIHSKQKKTVPTHHCTHINLTEPLVSTLRPTRLPENGLCVCVEGDEGLSDGTVSSLRVSISAGERVCVYVRQMYMK